jgi:hypothetical protein
MDSVLRDLFPHEIEWEGPEGLDLIAWWSSDEQGDAGLNSLFLVRRTGSLAATIGVLAGLDQFTPTALKTEAYYALIGIVFLSSIRPFDTLYVPKKYDKIVLAIIENPKQLRRTVKEADLYGVMDSREALKMALKFLCDKKILEPIGSNEYLIARRPLHKLGLLSF